MNYVYCKFNKGKHQFYVRVNNKDYYLFSQNYKRTNDEVFKNGVVINRLNRYASYNSTSVRKTVTKFKPYIHYIEGEYGVIVYEKSKLKSKRQKVKTSYKREIFNWKNIFESEEVNLCLD